MALRAVPEHPKFFALKDALGLKKYQALGILEALWHFTGKFAIQGNIGKFTDSQIEAWLEWDGDKGALIAGLVSSEWLDVSELHRLVVHDWKEHADQTTKKQIGRTGKGFVQDMSGHCMDKSKQNGRVSGPPVPAPEPVTALVEKKQQIPSRDKRGVDARHVPFKLAIETYWTFANKGTHLPFTWGPADAKQLSNLLAATPELTLMQFQALLQNRARSPGTAHGTPPHKWLSGVLQYSQPLNQFNRTTEAGNGTFKGKTESSLDAAHEAIAIIRARGQAERDSHASGEVGSEAASEAGPGRLLDFCGGSGELRDEGYRISDGVTVLTPSL